MQTASAHVKQRLRASLSLMSDTSHTSTHEPPCHERFKLVHIGGGGEGFEDQQVFNKERDRDENRILTP